MTNKSCSGRPSFTKWSDVDEDYIFLFYTVDGSWDIGYENCGRFYYIYVYTDVMLPEMITDVWVEYNYLTSQEETNINIHTMCEYDNINIHTICHWVSQYQHTHYMWVWQHQHTHYMSPSRLPQYHHTHYYVITTISTYTLYVSEYHSITIHTIMWLPQYQHTDNHKYQHTHNRPIYHNIKIHTIIIWVSTYTI